MDIFDIKSTVHVEWVGGLRIDTLYKYDYNKSNILGTLIRVTATYLLQKRQEPHGVTNPRMVDVQANKPGRPTYIPERKQNPKARSATGKRWRVIFRRRAFVVDGMIQTDRCRPSSYQTPSSNFQPTGIRDIRTGGAAARLGKHRKTVLGMYQGGRVIPELFTSLPPFKRDHPQTETTIAQDETVQLCLPLLVGVENPSRSIFYFNSHGLPRLEREKHVKYLHKSLQKLGGSYVAMDASRPWQIYWSLAGLSMLGENVQQYRERLILFPNSKTCWSFRFTSLCYN